MENTAPKKVWMADTMTLEEQMRVIEKYERLGNYVGTSFTLGDNEISYEEIVKVLRSSKRIKEIYNLTKSTEPVAAAETLQTDLSSGLLSSKSVEVSCLSSANYCPNKRKLPMKKMSLLEDVIVEFYRRSAKDFNNQLTLSLLELKEQVKLARRVLEMRTFEPTEKWLTKLSTRCKHAIRIDKSNPPTILNSSPMTYEEIIQFVFIRKGISPEPPTSVCGISVDRKIIENNSKAALQKIKFLQEVFTEWYQRATSIFFAEGKIKQISLRAMENEFEAAKTLLQMNWYYPSKDSIDDLFQLCRDLPLRIYKNKSELMSLKMSLQDIIEQLSRRKESSTITAAVESRTCPKNLAPYNVADKYTRRITKASLPPAKRRHSEDLSSNKRICHNTILLVLEDVIVEWYLRSYKTHTINEIDISESVETAKELLNLSSFNPSSMWLTELHRKCKESVQNDTISPLRLGTKIPDEPVSLKEITRIILRRRGIPAENASFKCGMDIQKEPKILSIEDHDYQLNALNKALKQENDVEPRKLSQVSVATQNVPFYEECLNSPILEPGDAIDCEGNYCENSKAADNSTCIKLEFEENKNEPEICSSIDLKENRLANFEHLLIDSSTFKYEFEDNDSAPEFEIEPDDNLNIDVSIVKQESEAIQPEFKTSIQDDNLNIDVSIVKQESEAIEPEFEISIQNDNLNIDVSIVKQESEAIQPEFEILSCENVNGEIKAEFECEPHDSYSSTSDPLEACYKALGEKIGMTVVKSEQDAPNW